MPNPSLTDYAAAQAPKTQCRICSLPGDVLGQVRDAHAKRVSSRVVAKWLNEFHALPVSDQTVRRCNQMHAA